MTIKRRSAKQKGFNFQRAIAQKIREVFSLEEREVVSQP